jgi:hypothetical protein
MDENENRNEWMDENDQRNEWMKMR